jgi:hypothetical protein
LDRSRAFVANTEIKRELELEEAKRWDALKQKYASIDSMNRHQKLEVLSRKGVNPLLLKDPNDRLNVNLNKWKEVADNAVLNHYSDKQKEDLAGKYYDMMLAPQYADMGIAPMNREVWMKQSFKEATQYNLANAYDNDILHDMKHGWNAGVPALARAGEAVYNMVTNFISSPKPATDKEYSRWYHPTASSPKNFTDALHPDSIVNKGSRIQQEEHQFWADALPEKGGWAGKATSFVSEQAAQLPVYVALALTSGVAGEAIAGGTGGAEALTSLRGTTNLTSKLALTPIGKKALTYLVSGAEGTAIGISTRPKGDKANAWQDGLSQAIFHMGFDVVGKAGGKAWEGVKGFRGIRKTLSDAVQEAGGKGSLTLEELKRRQDDIELAAQGKRRSNATEQYEDFKKEAATNIAVMGIHGQRQVYANALRHIENMETVEHGNWTEQQVKDHEASLLKDDPGRWSPVIAAANFVRTILKDQKLKDLKPDSPLMKKLVKSVSQLIVDAGSEVTKHAPEVGAHEASDGVAKVVQNGSGRKTLEYFKQLVTQEAVESGARGMMTEEQLEKMAQKRFADYVQKAQREAAEQLKTDAREKVDKALSNVRKGGESGVEEPSFLKDSKPRYGYGKKLFNLIFEDPRDKAAYILANKGESAAHAPIRKWYQGTPRPDNVSMHGGRVRAFIKGLARDANPAGGPLKIPSQRAEYLKEEAPITPRTAEDLKAHREEARKEGASAHVDPLYEQRTRRGKDSVSFSAKLSYRVALQKAARKAGVSVNVNSKEFSEWLTKLYDGMSDKDFALHLEDNFYPQALKDAGVWFEHQTAGASGHEYPNFLAFMRNYDPQMPEQMSKELEDRLVGTQKFQDSFRAGARTGELLDFYSKGMYNHVDDFLGSGHWPEETNIFRSSFDNVRQTTKYQKQLLQEKMQEEVEALGDAFSENPEAQTAAIKQLKELQKRRMTAFSKSYDKDPNSRQTVYELNNLISDQITSKGSYERWRF